MLDWLFTKAVVTIEFIGALLIVGYVVRAILILVTGGPLEQARLLVAEGAVLGLSFKVAGTLLKTIELQSWQQIGIFVVIFALRTLLKRLFLWEQAELLRAERRAPTSPAVS